MSECVQPRSLFSPWLFGFPWSPPFDRFLKRQSPFWLVRVQERASGLGVTLMEPFSPLQFNKSNFNIYVHILRTHKLSCKCFFIIQIFMEFENRYVGEKCIFLNWIPHCKHWAYCRHDLIVTSFVFLRDWYMERKDDR